MSGPRIYRPSVAQIVLFGAGLLLFAWLAAIPLIHLVSGTPIEIRNGRSPETSTVHPSKPSELWFLFDCWFVPCLACLYLVLDWVNGFLIVDDEGLRARNFMGRTRFECRWAEIDRVVIVGLSRGPSYYVVHAGSRHLKLVGLQYVDEVVAAIKARSPHVRFE